MLRYHPLILFIAVCLTACGPKKEPVVPKKTEPLPEIPLVQAPQFNSDSAFQYIKEQVRFGPRVPNTKAHKNCGDYLISTLKRLSAEVVVQEATVTAYTGVGLKIRNIIGRYKPEISNRVALFAHWDTRPFADNEPAGTKAKPNDGADDGASGVAVLLEIARNVQQSPLPIGLDIIFFDGEDYGDAGGAMNSYCLGSQYWAKNPPIPGYYAKYGILLDMVGAKGARFCKEGYSRQFASSVVENIWRTAQQLGYGNYFLMKECEGIADDHYFVNTLAKIPTVDIINFDREPGKSGFGPHWHTFQDNIDIIDKDVLKAVGQTVMQVIYNEK